MEIGLPGVMKTKTGLYQFYEIFLLNNILIKNIIVQCKLQSLLYE